MISVFGSSGLLGSTICNLYPKTTLPVSRELVDITDYAQIYSYLSHTKPQAVINCAGVVRSRQLQEDEYWKINAEAPHTIALICEALNIRFIQVGTDCVFDGKRGEYSEFDTPCPEDIYGKSKLAGEVPYGPHLTVRTSFVGWPDPKGRGLIAWLMTMKGQEVRGYKNVLWNGVTAHCLALMLVDLCGKPHITGLRHLHGGEVISKCDLLNLVNDQYELGCTITPVPEPAKNMTLVSEYGYITYQMGGYSYKFSGLLRYAKLAEDDHVTAD